MVDVLAKVLAFAIADGGSREVRVSQVLPGLTMALLEEALGLSLSMDDTEMAGWLMERFGAQDQ